MANKTFPNTKKLSAGEERALSTLKKNAELEPNKYYIPAIKVRAENYIIPVSDFGKGGGSDKLCIFDTVAKDDKGLQYLIMSSAEGIIDTVGIDENQDLRIGLRDDSMPQSKYKQINGFVENKAIDMSNISTIEWVTWHSQPVESYDCAGYGDANKYWIVYNPYINLYLDTSTMVIGRIYTIRIHAVRSMFWDPLAPESEGGVKFVDTPDIKTTLTNSIYGTADGNSMIFTLSDGRYVLPYFENTGNWPALTDETAKVDIKLASEVFVGLPDGVEPGDRVVDIYCNSVSTYSVIARVIINNRYNRLPRAATNIAATISTRVNGTVNCKFNAIATNSNNVAYVLDIPTKNISDDIELTDLKQRIPTVIDINGDANDKQFYWKKHNPSDLSRTTDNGHSIRAKDDGPKFYWPYLLASGDSADGVSKILPKLHIINTNAMHNDHSNSSYITPDEPTYDATVYMCRIDDNHVLVLGY